MCLKLPKLIANLYTHNVWSGKRLKKTHFFFKLLMKNNFFSVNCINYEQGIIWQSGTASFHFFWLCPVQHTTPSPLLCIVACKCWLNSNANRQQSRWELPWIHKVTPCGMKYVKCAEHLSHHVVNQWRFKRIDTLKTKGQRITHNLIYYTKCVIK